MFRAIVFDFDGVLVESVEVKTKAFARLFADEDSGVVKQIVAYHLRNVGISRFEKFKTIYRDILHRPFSSARFESLCATYADLVVDEVVCAPWVEGAERFLGRYRDRYLFFVVSGTPQDELRGIIQRRGATRLFDEALGSPQSKDQLLLQLMRTHVMSPVDMVFIGDAESDWMAAREVGMSFIWRQSPNGLPRLDGFTGPVIRSLADLDGCLTDLARKKDMSA
jgi:phosphoglycolate phosphatase-like HAD superfamily hydrolase